MRFLLVSIFTLFAGGACSILSQPPSVAPAEEAPPLEPPPAEERAPDVLPTVPPTPVPPTPTPAQAHALPDPAGFGWRLVTDGLTRPLGVASADDGRLFILEQAGVVRIFADGQLQAAPFLDIRDRVLDSANEQGLLGLAFHPDYADNGAFFVNYTGSGGGTFISRFLVSGADPNLADPASESVLLRYDQPFANHNGGAMAFGPDGYLYIGSGDGGAAGDPQGHGQRLDSLLGKILRLDVSAGGDSYSVPPDNPFAGGGGLPEIWAYGLRNPWRIAFDPLTGDLYLGDVGQNAWEEIDFLPASAGGGANFGWSNREASHRFAGDLLAGMVDPIAEYANGPEGCSVTGGVVVRDPDLPEWAGVYLYGDFCTGRIWGLVRDEAGVWQNRALFETPYRITSFGLGSNGQVYLADRQGRVLQLVREP